MPAVLAKDLKPLAVDKLAPLEVQSHFSSMSQANPTAAGGGHAPSSDGDATWPRHAASEMAGNDPAFLPISPKNPVETSRAVQAVYAPRSDLPPPIFQIFRSAQSLYAPQSDLPFLTLQDEPVHLPATAGGLSPSAAAVPPQFTYKSRDDPGAPTAFVTDYNMLSSPSLDLRASQLGLEHNKPLLFLPRTDLPPLPIDCGSDVATAAGPELPYIFRRDATATDSIQDSPIPSQFPRDGMRHETGEIPSLANRPSVVAGVIPPQFPHQSHKDQSASTTSFPDRNMLSLPSPNLLVRPPGFKPDKLPLFLARTDLPHEICSSAMQLAYTLSRVRAYPCKSPETACGTAVLTRSTKFFRIARTDVSNVTSNPVSSLMCRRA